MKNSGNKSWNIRYKKSVAKDIKKLSRPAQKIIQQVIEEKIRVDPMYFGTPLRRSLKGLFKLRVGSYRIIYSIEEKTITIYVISIAHRKDVYKKLQ